MAFKSWLAEAGCYDEVIVTHKVKTNVKPIRRKPAVHVSMAGYTPAEEKVMQERKIALIEQHNAQLEAIKNHTDKTVQHLEKLQGAFEAFTAVLTAFLATAAPKTRAPRAEKASAVEQAKKDFEPEPAAPPAAENASPPAAGTPSRIHAVPDAPTGPSDVRHASIRGDQGKAEKPAPTIDSLRSALLDFMAKNGRGAGEEKLAAFKAKKISDIPQADWPAFAASLG